MASDKQAFVDQISSEDFAEWYRERKFARNIREGKPYFNGPSRVPPPERHSPSSLLQCHRKIVYRQENAPAEQEKPEGIFWTGRRFEEDIIAPYLRDIVGNDTYVRNSMWIDFEEETDEGDVRFKGTTDPCIVDREAKPLLPTEVKTKEEVDHLDEPNRHHRAQVHAYMRGLTEKHDRDVDEAIILYGSRKKMNVRAFRVSFTPEFWNEVVEWAARHTDRRERDVLPAADPEYDWECQFCDYRHRCGQSDEPYADEGTRGFLPMFLDYPREQVKEYLRAHDDARLTPTLAQEYPNLADEYAVRKWVCTNCQTTYCWTEIDHEHHSSESPLCPVCADAGTLSFLIVSEIETLSSSTD